MYNGSEFGHEIDKWKWRNAIHSSSKKPTDISLNAKDRYIYSGDTIVVVYWSATFENTP